MASASAAYATRGGSFTTAFVFAVRAPGRADEAAPPLRCPVPARPTGPGRRERHGVLMAASVSAA